MATKTIERSYPGRSRAEIYAEVEKVIRRMAARFSLVCSYDPAACRISARGPLGIVGECRVVEGKATLDLTHGLAAIPVVGKVKATIEESLDALFA
jgi:hypothetical protein